LRAKAGTDSYLVPEEKDATTLLRPVRTRVAFLLRTRAQGLTVCIVYNTHMTEVAVSTRISRDTKALVEDLMREERIDRSAALRKLLHMGADEYRRRKALEALAAGKVSFGEAAEMAGLTLWEFRDLVKARRVRWVAEDVAKDVRHGLHK